MDVAVTAGRKRMSLAVPGGAEDGGGEADKRDDRTGDRHGRQAEAAVDDQTAFRPAVRFHSMAYRSAPARLRRSIGEADGSRRDDHARRDAPQRQDFAEEQPANERREDNAGFA